MDSWMTARDEGWESYNLGYSRDLNPFAHGSIQEEEWYKGWDACEEYNMYNEGDE